MPKTFAEGELLTAAAVNNELNPHTAPQIPARVATGTVAVNLAGQTLASYNVTFPPGRFTVPPIVTASLNFTAGRMIVWLATAPTTDGVTLVAGTPNVSAITGSGVLHWHAIQMTPTSAAG